MLSEKEMKFLAYWEAHRIHYSSFGSKLSRGLPMATIFILPIFLFVMGVYIFFPEWYAKVSSGFAGSVGTILIALSIAIVFFAYFRMHFLWEMNEQQYKELIWKQKKENAADQSRLQSSIKKNS